jgi:cyclophilin family peptidyl-prolyl cis-trans isomerase
VGTDKRERKKANRDARRAAEAAAEARRRRIRLVRNALILVVVLIVVGFLLAGCADDDAATSDPAAAEEDSDPTAEGDDPAEDRTTDGNGDDTAVAYGTGACPPAEGLDEPVIDFDAPFEQCIDPAGAYTAEVETTEGTVSVELDTERTPLTTNNFVSLARSGYYTETDLFRTEAPTGIIQGGSPHTQSNADPGPGYTIPDEGLPFTPDDYGPGTLAMARTAAPDSAGGQFFFLSAEGGRYLGDPAQLGEAAGTYTAFGEVTDGLDVLEAIAALDDGSGAPGEAVAITSVTISET